MNKRRFRINALDIAILVVIIAVAVIVVFRSDIDEFLSEPETEVLTVTVRADSVDEDLAMRFRSGNNVTVCFGDDLATKTEAVVTSAAITPFGADGKADIVITLRLEGYRKFGIFYNTNDQKISGDLSVTVNYSGSDLNTVLTKVVFEDKTVVQ